MRLLLVSSIVWRLTDHLLLSWWRTEVFGGSSRFFADPYTFHVLLAPFWSVFIQCCLILSIAFLWLRKGGLWGILLILADSTIADQSLPMGWGALASHPAILLCLIWDLGTESVRKHFHWVFLVQVSFMYGMSVLSKDYHFWLVPPGSAAKTLDGEILSTSFGRALSGSLSPSGGVVLDGIILGVQLSALLFLFFWRSAPARKLIALNLILFHAISGLLLNIQPFALACLSLVSMAFPQRPVREQKSHSWAAIFFLTIWITGMVTAVFWIWVPGFQFLRLRQSWRIMERPVVMKELKMSATRNGETIEMHGREEEILRQALIRNETLKEYFLESLCRKPEESVRVLITSGNKIFVDRSAECSALFNRR